MYVVCFLEEGRRHTRSLSREVQTDLIHTILPVVEEDGFFRAHIDRPIYGRALDAFFCFVLVELAIDFFVVDYWLSRPRHQ